MEYQSEILEDSQILDTSNHIQVLSKDTLNDP